MGKHSEKPTVHCVYGAEEPDIQAAVLSALKTFAASLEAGCVSALPNNESQEEPHGRIH